MVDLAGRAFDAVDGQVMKVANEGVRAYNWITGRTKADLANKLLDAFIVLGVTGSALHEGKIFLVPASVSASFVMHELQRTNLTCENDEISAAERGFGDYRVESYKKSLKYLAPIAAFSSGIPIRFSSATEDICSKAGMALMGAGNLFVAASFYVMRADYLPPKKNCVIRGIAMARDKLTEIVDKYKPRPGPALARTGFNQA